MKRAQYRDAPPQNIYSHIDHKWGYDGSGLRVEQSFRREFATIIPSLGVPICSCRHHCDSAGAFCFQRVAPAGDVACQEHRGQRCHQRCTFALVRVRVVVVDDVVQRVVEQFGRRHAQGDGRGRDGVEIPCGVEVHSGRYGGLGHAGRLAQGLLFEFFLGQVQAHVPRGDFPQAFSQFDCLCPCRGVAGHVRSFRLRALGGLCAPCYGRRAWLCNTTASPVRSGRTGPEKTWETKALRTVLALGAGLIDNLGRDSERFK